MNRIRAQWANSAPAFGTFVTIPAIRSAEVVGRAGYDWAVIEQQHAAVAQESLLPLIHALELGGTTTMVRVGENDLIGIARALDLGASGVIVPMVSTPEQARAAGAATRFPPDGTRSYGGLRGYATPQESNEDVVCIVMIETPEGLEHLDEIAASPGVDGLLLGPADLGLRLGHPVSTAAAHPEVLETFDLLLDACKRHGRQAGLVAFNSADARNVVERGATFVPLNSDLGHVAAGAAADVRAIRELRTATGVGA